MKQGIKNCMPDFDKTATVTIPDQSAGGETRTFKAGDLVGGYRLKGLLGQGGMGYVFLAEHTMFDREYALKLIGGQFGDAARARFELEGKIIAHLDHPNIVKVHNMGLDQGCPFYVMDLLKGRTLDEHIEANRKGDSKAGRAAWSLDDWIDIFMGSAAGLAHAHSKQVVHRDIKPSNIALTHDNGRTVPKILDFGIAKTLDKHAAQQFLTQQGDVIGSPLYMSPEQSLGLPVDKRTDIYSLGCTFFECLTGRVPFRGATAMQTIMMHQQDAVPSVGKYAPNLEHLDAIDTLLGRMMAKKPEQRYQSMHQVIHDLERLKQGLPVGGRAITAITEDSRHEDSADLDLDLDLNSNARGGVNRPLLFTAATITALTLSVVAGSLFTTPGKRAAAPVEIEQHPESKAVIDFKPGKHSQIVRELARGLDADSKEAIAAFKAAAPIVIKQSKEKDKPAHYVDFPSWPIGDIMEGSIQIVKGSGRRYFDNYRALALATGSGDARQVFNYPQIFDKIDPTTFQGLNLHGLSSANVPTDGDLLKERKSTEYMLSAASKWTTLAGCTLQHLMLTRTAALNLSRTPNLEFISMTNVKLDARHFASLPLMEKLENLEIIDMSSVDPIIEAVAKSGNLKKLKVANCNLSASALKSIAKCAKLKELEITDKGSKTLLPLLVNLPTLKTLTLGETPLTARDIQNLLRLPKLENLYLDSTSFKPSEMKTLEALDPRIRFL